MSKVKSALGEFVDFEMMKIMADYGTVQPTAVTTNVSANSVVNPNVLVRDVTSSHVRIMRTPEYANATVTIPSPVESKVTTAPKITITTPETVDETIKPAKKGAKNEG
jgi:hypothetical protein